MTEPSADGPRRRWTWRNLMPLGILVALVALVLIMGWHEALSPRNIADSRDSLQAFVTEFRSGAIALYMITYAVAIALSLPLGAIMTVLGGFLFGPVTGAIAVVVAATAGATAIFLIARTALGDALAARAGPFIERMRQGFQDNALSYMLFLRLVPAFPFTLVNVAPALLGVRLRTYVIGTAVGIVPGTFAYAFVGGGLDSIIVKAQASAGFQACMALEETGAKPAGSCPLHLDYSHFITPELIVAFVALGVVALIPVIMKSLRRRRG